MDTLFMEGVELFRQCQNMIPTIATLLTALENISKQKRTLAEAVRRQQTHDDQHHHPRTVAAPLGVLNYFSPFLVELFMHQHQKDETELLAALSIQETNFRNKMNTFAKLVGEVEPVGVDNDNSKEDAYYSSYYQNKQNSIHTTITADDVAHNDALFILYNLYAVLAKYSHVFQESIFALREALLHDVVDVGPRMDRIEHKNNENRNKPPQNTSTGADILYTFIHDYKKKGNHNNNSSKESGLGQLLFQQRDGTFSDALLDLKEFLEMYWEDTKNDMFTEQTIVALS